MAYKLTLGSKIKNSAIQRSSVADNFTARAVLLGFDQIYAKQVAYDSNTKSTVEVDQEAILKYRFSRAIIYYYIPVARLNTDIYGRVVSEDFTIEYVRLTEGQYEEFARQATEMGTFVSVCLKKVAKKGANGQDFSYVDVTPSNYGANGEIPQAVFAKLEQMNATPGFSEGVWSMIDLATSISVAEYEKVLAESANATHQAGVGQGSTPQTYVPAPPVPVAPQPQQVSAPQSVAPQSVAPQSVAPQSVAPQSVAPQSVPSQGVPRQVTPQPVGSTTVMSQEGTVTFTPKTPTASAFEKFKGSQEANMLAGADDVGQEFAAGSFEMPGELD